MLGLCAHLLKTWSCQSPHDCWSLAVALFPQGPPIELAAVEGRPQPAAWTAMSCFQAMGCHSRSQWRMCQWDTNFHQSTWGDRHACCYTVCLHAQTQKVLCWGSSWHANVLWPLVIPRLLTTLNCNMFFDRPYLAPSTLPNSSGHSWRLEMMELRKRGVWPCAQSNFRMFLNWGFPRWWEPSSSSLMN